MNNPDTGDHILTGTLTSTTPGNNCPASSTDPRCTTTVAVAQLVIDSTADVSTTTPGGVVHYTTTLTNTGQTPYHNITLSSDASGLIDDATGNGDQTATSGTFVIGTTGAVWTGDIPVGGTVTLVGSVTVNNPDTGNHVLTEINTSDAPGSNCPDGSTDPRCGTTIDVLTPALTITKTANTTAAVPGATVTYTITVADTGQTPYTGAVVTDSLDGVLADAAYNNDAAATAGTVSYASPDLTWTGNLAPGDTATITYTVTVNNPDTGGKLMVNFVTSTDPGSTCPFDNPEPGCVVSIPVLTPALTIVKTASAASATPGQQVTYTITVTNTGQTPYTGAVVTDDLTGLLDDAAYGADAAATRGAVSYASPVLTWTGNLTPGQAATITYTVTVDNPETGDNILTNTVTSAAPGSNCGTGSTDPRCTSTVPVATLTITNTANVGTTTPGGRIDYTITITNTGQTRYEQATVTDDLTAVTDDSVAFGNDGATTVGSISYVSPNLTWTGDLEPGQSAIVTFSVTVNNPDTGDKTITSTITSAAPGNTCPASGPAPACTSTVTVLIPALTIAKTASTTTTTPGSTVGYTVTVTDTGPTPYTAATVTDSLDGVLSDAAYNNDAAATSGAVSYASPDLTWTGSLNPGDTATITYTVTVNNPDNGDKRLVNFVTSTDPGSTCPSDSPAPGCTVTVTDLIPALTITKTANTAAAVPGSTVGYTITVTDTGQTPYTAATATDDLSGVLGDAAYNHDAAASAGTVSYASPDLTWTGRPHPRRHRHHHLHRHREQPRHRPRNPVQHRDLGRARQHVPGREPRPGLCRHRGRGGRPAHHHRPGHRQPGVRSPRRHTRFGPGHRPGHRRPRLRCRLDRDGRVHRLRHRHRHAGRDHPRRRRPVPHRRAGRGHRPGQLHPGTRDPTQRQPAGRRQRHQRVREHQRQLGSDRPGKRPRHRHQRRLHGHHHPLRVMTMTTRAAGPRWVRRALPVAVAAQPVEHVVGVVGRDPDHRPDRVGQRHPRHVQRHGGRIRPGRQLPVEFGAEVERDPDRLGPDRGAPGGTGVGRRAAARRGGHPRLLLFPLRTHDRIEHRGAHRPISSRATCRQMSQPVCLIGMPKLCAYTSRRGTAVSSTS